MASPASLKLAKPFCTVPHARGLCDSFDQSEDGAPGPPGAALECRGGLTLAGLYRRVRSGARMGHAAGETPPIRSHEPPGRFGARPLTPSVHPGSNRGRAARGQGTGHRSFVGASADAPTTHLGRNRPHLRLGEDGARGQRPLQQEGQLQRRQTLQPASADRARPELCRGSRRGERPYSLRGLSKCHGPQV